MTNVVDQLLAAADGTQKWSDAFKNVGQSVAQFAAQFLRQMASVIMQIMATRAAMALLGLFGGAASAAPAAVGTGLGTWGLGASVPAAIAHSGAVVGQPGGMSRSASASWFANAPRYHSGTVVGLKADEQAAILQKGEEVLAKDNPRNILNQTAKNAAQAAKQPMTIRNMLISDPNFVPDAMASAAGDTVITTYLRQNAVTARQALGIK
ncbi:tail length tape measure protein [Burkholderia phage BcepNazgul]|uniref:Conserved tail assembly protein n=1 Tax=Burkholderia phage BcepNazgul TaxID=242861 RepID=Q6UYJ3_9CAUD|nr:tail length tape measure protein [Burkholderia phage BcepNazgul]AAQ63348.1 conserved tail assembly protein [Burkholderia phage BcepNazgul]